MEVLPAPITVNPDGECDSDTRSFGATTRAAGSTANGGECVDGSEDSM